MTITVTQDDLLKGIINSRTGDPLGLAISRAGLQQVEVGKWEVLYSLNGVRRCATLPWQAIEFLKRLSYGDRFEVLPLVRPTLDQRNAAKARLKNAAIRLLNGRSPGMTHEEMDHAKRVAAGDPYSAPFTFILPDGVPL